MKVRAAHDADVLVAVLAELAALRRRVEVLERRRRPRDSDDTRVLLVLVGCVEGRRFSAHEVFRQAKVARERVPELAEALEKADCDSPKSLGLLFRRVEGRDIGGVRLNRVGKDRHGWIWSICVTTPTLLDDEWHAHD